MPQASRTRSRHRLAPLALTASVAFVTGFGAAAGGFLFLDSLREPRSVDTVQATDPQPASTAPTALTPPLLDAEARAPAPVDPAPIQLAHAPAQEQPPLPAALHLDALATSSDDRQDDDQQAADPQVDQAPADDQQDVEVVKGDTLIDILLRAGTVESEAHAAVAAMKGVYDPRQLRVGDEVSVTLVAAGDDTDARTLAGLTIPLGFAKELRLGRNQAGEFTADAVELPLERKTHLATGEIQGSLYDGARAAGMPAETIMRFIKLMSWDVDFQRDIQGGDSFEVLYDTLSTADGDASKVDDVVFARLTVQDREIALYRFERDDGSLAWYDQNGKSIRKSLLKTPVDGARLSSGFGMRRHPVLGYSRMHKGTDFAAPMGTPIYAAGDGVVEFAGRKSGYGNFVKIRHNGTYATGYGHMRRFAPALKAGRKVKQGEVIGYVGMTGLATGPHLHYEIFQNGTQVNPLTVKQAFADELGGAELSRFKAVRASIDRSRDELAEPTLVAETKG